MLRFLTCGESHGSCLTVIVDGMPAGLPVDVARINKELSRRQQGYGRGARQKIERDEVEITGGIRHGITTGAPIGMIIKNRDWENWRHVMSVAPVDLKDEVVREQLAKKAIVQFRPGHADLAGTIKFRHHDIRNVLERASARETAARVAAGALCQQFLDYFGICVIGHVVQVADIEAAESKHTIQELERRVMVSEMFCADEVATEKIKELIKKTWQEGDSLGGTIEVLATGLPIGLGSYTQWDRRLDGKLAQALMSVQAMKAVEIGDGIAASSSTGSNVHDAIYPSNKPDVPFRRKTNRAGGIEGGMTNGESLRVRAYMKPIPTIRQGLDSISFPEMSAHKAHYERSDVCAIAAASVVCKAMVCYVLAEAFLDRFGGDTISAIEASVQSYRVYLRALARQEVPFVNPWQDHESKKEAHKGGRKGAAHERDDSCDSTDGTYDCAGEF